MRTLHRVALACLALAACAPPPMPAPPAPPPPQSRAAVLARCSSTEGPAGADTVTATEAGSATLRVGSGGVQHMLQVPPGGAKPGTVFILTALPTPRVGVEAHVRGEDSYTFLGGRRATLRLTAQHCTEGEFGQLTSPTILRIERDSTLTVLPSRRDPGSGRILWTELPSLSGYAIGGS